MATNNEKLLAMMQSIKTQQEMSNKVQEDLVEKVDKIYVKMYENGLSAQVNTLWQWRSSMVGGTKKVLLGLLMLVIVALLSSLVGLQLK